MIGHYQGLWKISTIISVLALSAIAGGCTGDPPVQPVNITASDFCRIQPRPISWDVKDTPPTIKDVRQFNARWASRCGSKKGAPVS